MVEPIEVILPERDLTIDVFTGRSSATVSAWARSRRSVHDCERLPAALAGSAPRARRVVRDGAPETNNSPAKPVPLR